LWGSGCVLTSTETHSSVIILRVVSNYYSETYDYGRSSKEELGERFKELRERLHEWRIIQNFVGGLHDRERMTQREYG